eukprot:GHVL01007274.1.p1 GENE.GHVL01007274.1~~GHVL01007274.1.p1  ORF type:complete len:306 (+),score=48.55 GHVL01007274.1:99-1016(+)
MSRRFAILFVIIFDVKCLSLNTNRQPNASMFIEPSGIIEKLMDNKALNSVWSRFLPETRADRAIGHDDVMQLLTKLGNPRSAPQVTRMMYSARELLDGQQAAKTQLNNGNLSLNQKDVGRLFMRAADPQGGGISFLTSALAFQNLDTDHNLSLSRSESQALEDYLKTSGSSLLSQDEGSFDMADENHDGRLSFDEFFKLAKSITSSSAFHPFKDPSQAQFLKELNGRMPLLPSDLGNKYRRQLGIPSSGPGGGSFLSSNIQLQKALKTIPGGLKNIENIQKMANGDFSSAKNNLENLVSTLTVKN